MASIENRCFKLDHARSSIRLILKIMILTLIIKRGIGIRILKHDSDFEFKNAPLITNQPVFALTLYCCVIYGEPENYNHIVFGLTLPGLEPTIYRTRCEHTITVSERVSEWLLFNTNSAICQLYHDENKLIFNEMMMRSALY
jgi:hypothetical protein